MAFLFASAAGCATTQRSTPLAPCIEPGESIRTVPVRVHRILDNQLTDCEGCSNNKGCRLSDAQIHEYMNHAKSYFLSCRVELQWNGQIITDRRDQDDVSLICPARRRPLQQFIVYDLQESPFYSSTHLNVFFVGNLRIRDPGNPDNVCGVDFAGLTVDPSNRLEFPNPGGGVIRARKHIFFNDLAYETPNYTAPPVLPNKLLEHEFGHWFLRNPPWYNEIEHCGDRFNPCPQAILMSERVPKTDDFNEAQCERRMIYDKANTWNAP